MVVLQCPHPKADRALPNFTSVDSFQAPNPTLMMLMDACPIVKYRGRPIQQGTCGKRLLRLVRGDCEATMKSRKLKDPSEFTFEIHAVPDFVVLPACHCGQDLP